MLTNSNKTLFSLLLCTLLFSGPQALAADGRLSSQSGEMPLVTLKINDQILHIEYAATLALRSVGLMHRTSLCQNCGMLFKFDNPRRVSMWMKDTFIPLDVAFIRSDGLITDIKALKPQDLTHISASEKILFALEMNRGWFKRHGITVGGTLQIEP
ncbi:MAG: uncharacterized membrane protein (UPF0127 family) [Motiliproteus sp.]|jgi:uncharacterized membrane protein (UPF0127 family)